MTACQLLQAATKAVPNVLQQIADGDFSSLLCWLRQNVHSKCSLYQSLDAHLQQITGCEVNPHILAQYLTDKYSTIYKL